MIIEMDVTNFDTTKIYQIKPIQIGGYLHNVDYHKGNYIRVRVLEGPAELGRYKLTTRGVDGEHLGPGGGWAGESVLYLHPFDLEEFEEPAAD